MDGLEIGERYDTMGLRGNDLRHLYYKDIRVPPENVLGEPGDGFQIAMQVLNNGRLSLRRTVGHWKPLALEQVNIELRDFSASSAFPFSLSAQVGGGGTVKLDGKAGPINPTDSAMTPVNVNLKVEKLDLARSGMTDSKPGHEC